MKSKTTILYSALSLFILTIFFFSCEDLDENYAEFLEEGEIVYLAKPDSISITEGFESLQVSLILKSDPRPTSGQFIDSDGTILKEFSFENQVGTDTITFLVEDLEEGVKNSDIILMDENGNESLPVNINYEIYGDFYVSNLSTRTVDTMYFFQTDTLVVGWSNPTFGSLRSEVSYVDSLGQNLVVEVPNERNFSVLYDVQLDNSFSVTTVYQPSEHSIEFYSEEVTYDY